MGKVFIGGDEEEREAHLLLGTLWFRADTK